MNATMVEPTLHVAGKTYTMTLAAIESTHLGFEDHGMYTVNLNFRWGSSGQGLGHRIVSEYDEESDRQVGTALGLDLIIRIIEVVGCETWERLQDRTAYVLKSDDSPWIQGIANSMEPRFRHLLFDEHRSRFGGAP